MRSTVKGDYAGCCLSMKSTFVANTSQRFMTVVVGGFDGSTKRHVMDVGAHTASLGTRLHHLRALTWVDRIILLDSSSVAAQGTHSTLYSRCALYRSLYTRNQKSEDELLNGQATTDQPVTDVPIST